MANVGTSLKNWSTTEASNQPDGTDSATIAGDLRAIQAGVRHLRSNDTIASASTCDLGSKDAEYLSISGTTTITALGTVSAGIVKRVVFEGALTLTHNATSLILPGAASITTAAGDAAEFVSLGGGNWRCTNYHRANGTSIVSVTDGDKGDITVSSSGATWTIDNGVVTASKFGSGAVEGAITASFSGYRNRVINSGMQIDQRNSGASQTITAAAALAYTVDRWYAYCTGANVTGQRVSGTAPNQFNYRFTGAASVTKIGFAQRIESANCQDLAETTATLSVDLANSLLSTVTWTAWYANSADTFGTLASPTRTQIATGTFTVSSSLTRYNTNISIPAAATTGIEIEFSVGAQTSGTWTIGRVQLEAGSVATPFITRSVGQNLALCQRYTQLLQHGGTGRAETTTKMNLSFQVMTPMRTTPSASVLGTLVMRDLTGVTTRTAVTPGSITVSLGAENGAYMEFTPSSWTASNFTIGNIATLACSSGANGILLTAEL